MRWPRRVRLSDSDPIPDRAAKGADLIRLARSGGDGGLTVAWAYGMFGAAFIAVIAAVWRCRPVYLLATAVLTIAGLVVAILAISRPASTDPVDPNPDASFRIAALGDSYMSGEGAPSYFVGTDVSRSNRCHRTPTAYSYLLARELGASLTFVACSGAVTEEVTDAGQYPNSPEDVFGGRPQLDVLRDALPVDVVLLGIGGNDAGFAEIGSGCATPGQPDCRRSAAFWLRRLDVEVYPALLRTYERVREVAGDTPVFVLNYPNPIGPRSCGDILLGSEEISFVRGVFIERLNEVVAYAARVAQVRAIDLADSMEGHRICEVPLPRAAVNFVALGRTSGPIFRITLDDLRGLGQGTFHPNPLGHRLMAEPVRAALNAVREGRLVPLERPPERELPRFRAKEAGAPVGPHPFPEGTRCQGDELAVITPMSVAPDVRRVEFTSLAPRSRACYREYRGRWRSERVSPAGAVRVPVDLRRAGVGSTNEILTQHQGGLWSKVLVTRIEQAGETDPPPAPDDTVLYVIAALAVAVVVLLAILAVWRCRRRQRAAALTGAPWRE